YHCVPLQTVFAFPDLLERRVPPRLWHADSQLFGSTAPPTGTRADLHHPDAHSANCAGCRVRGYEPVQRSVQAGVWHDSRPVQKNVGNRNSASVLTATNTHLFCYNNQTFQSIQKE